VSFAVDDKGGKCERGCQPDGLAFGIPHEVKVFRGRFP
jgi:hypothetical protein